MKSKIQVEIDHPDLEIDLKNIKLLAQNVLRDEKISFDQLSLIFTTDEYVKYLHKTFLQINEYTDVITFNLSESSTIEGEIYISVDRATKNASKYGVNQHSELCRLVVHGILHLAGFDDTDAHNRQLMRRREDHYLEKYQPDIN